MKKRIILCSIVTAISLLPLITSGQPVTSKIGNYAKKHTIKFNDAKIKNKAKYIAVIECLDGINKKTAVTECFTVKMVAPRGTPEKPGK